MAMNPDYRNKIFPSLSPLPFETNFPPMCDPNALDFLQTCLVFDPRDRPHALEALCHPFFDELKIERKLMPNGTSVPTKLFDFTQNEYDYAGKMIEQSLLPDWLPDDWMGYVSRTYYDEVHKKKSE